MINIDLELDKFFEINSKVLSVTRGKKYRISSEFTGIKGEPYCAFFGVVLLDKDQIEIDRKIRWLNDFSVTKKNINIFFEAQTDNILFIYRINIETPIKAACKYALLPIEDINISEITSDSALSFDDPRDLVLPRKEELSTEHEIILEQNLVWLFGFPRSGTTWLGIQLLSYNTYTSNEPYIGTHLGLRIKLATGLGRRIDQNRYNPDYFFSNMYKETWVFYVRKLILNRIYSQFRNIHRKIILKEVGVVGADIIFECLPNSKIIILIRDGRDVIDSLLDSSRPEIGWNTRLGGRKVTPQTRLNTIEKIANEWVHDMKILMKLYDRHPNSLKYLIKYEDLRTNTVEELKKIYEFIGVEINNDKLLEISSRFDFENIPENQKGSGKFYRFATPWKWQESFSKEEKSIMRNLMSETLQRLGYKS